MPRPEPASAPWAGDRSFSAPQSPAAIPLPPVGAGGLGRPRANLGERPAAENSGAGNPLSRSPRALRLAGDETAVPHTPRDGEGHGLVEAPRGPLIHHYTVENGLIAHAEFIIPTVHNSLAIERALRVAAERYVTPDHIDLELEKAVGRVVRAFDPCIACATH